MCAIKQTMQCVAANELNVAKHEPGRRPKSAGLRPERRGACRARCKRPHAIAALPSRQASATSPWPRAFRAGLGKRLKGCSETVIPKVDYVPKISSKSCDSTTYVWFWQGVSKTFQALFQSPHRIYELITCPLGGFITCAPSLTSSPAPCIGFFPSGRSPEGAALLPLRRRRAIFFWHYAGPTRAATSSCFVRAREGAAVAQSISVSKHPSTDKHPKFIYKVDFLRIFASQAL